jgi:hypothetical protein
LIFFLFRDGIFIIYIFLNGFLAEPPAFEVLPSLKRLKQRIAAAGRGQYDAVFMSGRYGAGLRFESSYLINIWLKSAKWFSDSVLFLMNFNEI